MPRSSLRISLCLLAGMLALVAPNPLFAQTPPIPNPVHPMVAHLYGLSADGENFAYASGMASLTDPAALRQALRPAIQAGPNLLWRMVPEQWPVFFAVRLMNPEGDGEHINFAATDALMTVAAESGAAVIPVLDQTDLSLLGFSKAGPEPSARFKFLSKLAGRYATPAIAKRLGYEGGPEVRATIPQWHERIDIFATPQGPRPQDIEQLVLDALAIRTGSGQASIVADIGNFSTGGDATAKLAAISKFCNGAIRSVLIGFCVDLQVDQADFAQATESLTRLRANSYLLPLSLGSITPSPAFYQDVEKKMGAAPRADGWTKEKTAACYLSALGAWCSAAAQTGYVFWNAAPTTDALGQWGRQPSELALAAGNLVRLLQPFYRSGVDRYGDIWVITYTREVEPDSYLVFWDYLSDPWARTAAEVEKDFLVPILQRNYRITPLVADAPLWPGSKTIMSTKLGLQLKLGRSPLYIEEANPGQRVPVALGMPDSLYEKTIGASTQAASSPASQTKKPIADARR